MKNSRWIPALDIAIFAGIPALITMAMAGAAFTPQEWTPTMVGFAIGVPLAAWLVFAALIVTRWRTRPTFETALGTRVWARGIDVTEREVSEALHLYANHAARAHKLLDLQTVLAMLGLARIEFTSSRLLGGKAGLQKGYAVRVYWYGGFGINATFHELHHMVDEVLLGIAPDYAHTRLSWWDLVATIKKAWRDGHPLSGA